MSGEDSRKIYILTTAANFFSRDPREFSKLSDDRHLSKFLDDLNLLMLVINAQNSITITTKVNISNVSIEFFLFFSSIYK